MALPAEGPGLDPVIHPIPRLRICAILDPVTEEEFATLRDLVQMSNSALSKQLSTLTDAGYVQQRRGVMGGRSRVWVKLTKAGRTAYAGHIQALTQLSAEAAVGRS